MNSEIIISNKTKKLTVLIANNKICAFIGKLELLKTFICHCELIAS